MGRATSRSTIRRLLHGSDELTLSAWFRVDQLRGWQALLWKGDMPDRHPWNNREFGLFIEESGYVHLCSTPVSRQRRGQLYVNTPGGTVRPAGRCDEDLCQW